jgi:hypothetical protein
LKVDKLYKDFDSIDVLRNIIRQLNDTDKYVFVDIDIDKATKNMIKNEGYILVRLGKGVLSKFKVDTAMTLRHREYFDKKSSMDCKRIMTAFDFIGNKGLIEYIENISEETINEFENKFNTVVNSETKMKFKDIEIIDDSNNDDETDTNDSDNDVYIREKAIDDDEDEEDYVDSDNESAKYDTDYLSEEDNDNDSDLENDNEDIELDDNGDHELYNDGYDFSSNAPKFRVLKSAINKNNKKIIFGIKMTCLNNIPKKDNKRIMTMLLEETENTTKKENKSMLFGLFG